MPSVTQDTQAILLLCSRLGQRDAGPKPLTTYQYSMLARWLQESSLRPRDLLCDVGRDRLATLDLKGLARVNVEELLERGAALAILLERWMSHGLWVVSRADSEYPYRYKNYLQHASPPVLFGVGEVSLLQCGGLAVVGSRNASEHDLEFARDIGAQCASQQVTIISGAAKGIDSESMRSVVDRGGRAIGVLAEGLGRAAVSPRYHDALTDGHLTLVSPYEPESRWFPHTAMDRNKLIYGLADAALVISSGDQTGGTWAGASEALRQKRIPIFVRTADNLPEGNKKLIQAGARVFSDESWGDLKALFRKAPITAPLFEQTAQGVASAGKTPTVPSQLPDQRHPNGTGVGALSADKDHQIRTDPYEYVVGIIPMVLSEPQDERWFARALHVVPTQAKAWLKRAVEEGIVRRLNKPVRYVANPSKISLFVDRKSS